MFTIRTSQFHYLPFNPRRASWCLFAGGCCLGLLAAVDAAAAGRWNLPSTPIQSLGCGFGAGYHAPMVVGYGWTGRPARPGVERVAVSPGGCHSPFGWGVPGDEYLHSTGGTSLDLGGTPTLAPQPLPADRHWRPESRDESLFAPPAALQHGPPPRPEPTHPQPPVESRLVDELPLPSE